MDPITLQIKESRQYVDSILQNCLRNEEPLLATLHESVNYSLQSGGKRVRPLFCFLVGELFGVQRDILASFACAVEMIHTSSLIMDDLPHMDNGRMRRGKPANHIVYGQDVAALASIGLLTRAYELIAEDKKLSNENKTKLIHNLAMTVGFNGMVGGQFVDLKFSNTTVDYSVLEYIHTHKTASLFMASGKGAAIVGNATDEELGAIEDYAKYLGFAFQIADDLIDTTGSAGDAGKDTKKDKGNFTKLFGVAKSRATIKRYAEKIDDVMGVFDGKCENLLAFRDLLLKKSL